MRHVLRSMPFVSFALVLVLLSTLLVNIVWAADLAPVTIDTDNGTGGIASSQQRKVFYAAGQYWVFYDNNSTHDIAYISSEDGATWDHETLCAENSMGADFSIWWDGTYVHAVHGTMNGENALQYRRYTPAANGVLTPSAAWQDVVTPGVGENATRPYVCVDTSGYPVISYTWDNTTTETPYVVKSNQDDGTWTTDNFNQQLTTDNGDWATTVLPISGGSVMAVYAESTNKVWGRFYRYSTDNWEAPDETDSAIETATAFSAVLGIDWTVHLAFQYTDDDIVYCYWYNGEWSTEQNIWVGDDVSDTQAPVMSVDDDGNLWCFWVSDPDVNHIYWTQWDYAVSPPGNTWDGVEEDWLTEVDWITDNASLTVAHSMSSTGFIPIVWTNELGSPYNIRFAALDVDVWHPPVVADADDTDFGSLIAIAVILYMLMFTPWLLLMSVGAQVDTKWLVVTAIIYVLALFPFFILAGFHGDTLL